MPGSSPLGHVCPTRFLRKHCWKSVRFSAIIVHLCLEHCVHTFLQGNPRNQFFFPWFRGLEGKLVTPWNQVLLWWNVKFVYIRVSLFNKRSNISFSKVLQLLLEPTIIPWMFFSVFIDFVFLDFVINIVVTIRTGWFLDWYVVHLGFDKPGSYKLDYLKTVPGGFSVSQPQWTEKEILQRQYRLAVTAPREWWRRIFVFEPVDQIPSLSIELCLGVST